MPQTISWHVSIVVPVEVLLMLFPRSVPLVSPAMGYLGGLPPLLIIASDAEVLRDEIVYV